MTYTGRGLFGCLPRAKVELHLDLGDGLAPGGAFDAIGVAAAHHPCRRGY